MPKRLAGGENLTKSESGRESAKKSRRGRRKHLPTEESDVARKMFHKSKILGIFLGVEFAAINSCLTGVPIICHLTWSLTVHGVR